MTPGRGSRAGLLGIALAVVACGGPGPTVAPSAALPSAGPFAPPSAVATGVASSSAAPVAVEPSLLDVAPAEVEGFPLTFDPTTSAELAASPDLAGDAEAIAIGLAIDPGTAGVEDFVIVNVVRLRDEVFSDEWFRDWRDSYDAGACDAAGGIRGNAEAEIDGRTVFIGSCEGGVLTYHVRLDDADLVVSMHGLGPRRFGEQVAGDLDG